MRPSGLYRYDVDGGLRALAGRSAAPPRVAASQTLTSAVVAGGRHRTAVRAIDHTADALCVPAEGPTDLAACRRVPRPSRYGRRWQSARGLAVTGLYMPRRVNPYPHARGWSVTSRCPSPPPRPSRCGPRRLMEARDMPSGVYDTARTIALVSAEGSWSRGPSPPPTAAPCRRTSAEASRMTIRGCTPTRRSYPYARGSEPQLSAGRRVLQTFTVRSIAERRRAYDHPGRTRRRRPLSNARVRGVRIFGGPSPPPTAAPCRRDPAEARVRPSRLYFRSRTIPLMAGSGSGGPDGRAAGGSTRRSRADPHRPGASAPGKSRYCWTMSIWPSCHACRASPISARYRR